MSNRVWITVSCSAGITKRLPTQTSVLLPSLNTGPTKGATVAMFCQVFSPEQRRFSCVLCQLLFIGLTTRVKGLLSRQVSPLETGDGCRFAPQSNSDMATSTAFNHSSTLPLLLITPMRFHLSSQTRLSRIEWKRGHWYCCYQRVHARSCSALPCPAFLVVVTHPGAGAIECLDRRGYCSGRGSFPTKRRELTLLADRMLAARAVEGDGV